MALDWTLIALIAWGCVGGALPDLLRLVKLLQVPVTNPPAPSPWTPSFWTSMAIMTVLGGLAAYLGGAKLPKEAVAFGFSAPEVLSRLAGVRAAPAPATPQLPTPPATVLPPGPGGGPPGSLLGWWGL